MEGMASRVKRRACSSICASSCFKGIISRGDSESDHGCGARRRRGGGNGTGGMGRRGRGKDPPEITYLFQSTVTGSSATGGTDGGGLAGDGAVKSLTLQSSFAPSLPMPVDEDELNEKFSELVVNIQHIFIYLWCDL